MIKRGAKTDRELRKIIEAGVRRGVPPISVEELRRITEEALQDAVRKGVVRAVGVDEWGRTVYESLICKENRH